MKKTCSDEYHLSAISYGWLRCPRCRKDIFDSKTNTVLFVDGGSDMKLEITIEERAKLRKFEDEYAMSVPGPGRTGVQKHTIDDALHAVCQAILRSWERS